MVMSHFRPVNSTATEEEKVTVRKQKLRCKYRGGFVFFVFSPPLLSSLLFVCISSLNFLKKCAVLLDKTVW